MSRGIRVLSDADSESLCDDDLAWSSITNAYCEFGRDPTIQSSPSVMTMGGGVPAIGNSHLPTQTRIKGAVVPNQSVAGVYIYTSSAPYMHLWDTTSREPIGILASDWLSKQRVATTIAVGIDTLAHRSVEKIVFFGAGPWARQSCRVVANRWSNADVVVIAAHFESAARFASTMPDNVRASGQGRAELRDASVAITLTHTQSPIIYAGDLDPGALVLSMGSAHEVDASFFRDSSALIVDDLNYARLQGDIRAWSDRGEVDEQQLVAKLRGNIGEVLLGTQPGRLDDAESIIGVLQGLTACDVALAKALLDRAGDDHGHLISL